MRQSTAKQQRGLGFFGFMLGAGLLVLGSMVSLKLIPAYLQNAEVNKLFSSIAHDPDMQKAPPREIRASFSKRASIDGITAIRAEDLEIESDSGKPVIHASYAVKVALAGNISLYLEFNPSSAAK